MTYLLDTSVIIDVLNDKRDRTALLKALVEKGAGLACCAINVIEVYAGMRPKEQVRTRALLNHLEYYELNRDVATRAGLWKNQYARRGATLSLADVTIAAVAVVHELTLLTDNKKDYPMPELRIASLP